MATRLLDRVPVDRIEAQARPVNLGRVLLTVLVGVFWLLGWLAGKTVIVLGVALGWAVSAVRVGWQDAHTPAEERRRGVP